MKYDGPTVADERSRARILHHENEPKESYSAGGSAQSFRMDEMLTLCDDVLKGDEVRAHKSLVASDRAHDG